MKRIIWLSIVLVTLHVLSVHRPLVVNATGAASFSPPASVTVKMYQLSNSGVSTGYTCTDSSLEHYGPDKWGCTAYCRGSAMCNTTRADLYPFSSEYATVAIEGTSCAPNGSYNCYLLDVVSQEMGSYYHPVALEAQAIAARTYAYWFIDQSQAIANSAGYQVFVPYRYHALGSSLVTLNAMARRLYLSDSATDYPIRAEFTADVKTATRTNPSYSAYLLGVADPISTACDANDDGVNLAGLSSEGASRWARGQQCSYPGALPWPGNSSGASWSVSWSNSFQILAHYYTGIHVRNANSGNAILTPERRFNALSLSVNGQQRTCTISGDAVTLRLQNTGTTTWRGNTLNDIRDTGYGYCRGSVCTSLGYLPQWLVAPGSDIELTLTVPSGSGGLRFGLYYKPAYSGNYQWFGESAGGSLPWFKQPIISCTGRLSRLVQAQ